jgi:hypothetical protein
MTDSDTIWKQNHRFSFGVFIDRKSLGITVTPEMEVLVKAPTDTYHGKSERENQKKSTLDY